MKTKLTIEIEEQLYEKALARAETEGRSVASLMEEAVRDFLAGKAERKPYKLQDITFRGELMPEANPDDRESLYEVMLDGEEPYKLKWQTERGQLQPGANPDNRSTLYKLMECESDDDQ